jgi:hypothetical protein
MHNSLFLFCILHFAFFINSCSVPSLENPECRASRDAVRQFYSFHFGNDMRPSPENLKLRQKFLTRELAEKLSASPATARDYFTATEKFPNAFRVGTCTAESSEKTVFQVLLLWHEEEKNIQREVKAEMVRENDQWLVNRVSDQ